MILRALSSSRDSPCRTARRSSESQIDETTELQLIGKVADHLREQRTRIQGLLQLSIVFGVAALVVAGLAFVVEKAFYVR